VSFETEQEGTTGNYFENRNQQNEIQEKYMSTGLNTAPMYSISDL